MYADELAWLPKTSITSSVPELRTLRVLLEKEVVVV